MRILEHIAQDIVDKTSEILQYPISITDNEGFIIGSTDKSRIGIFHKPSLEVIKRNTTVNCKSEIGSNVLPGISVPLKFNNKVIGVLGIVGDPKEVEKYVQLVKNQVEMMCQEAFRKEMNELKEKMVEVFVHQIIHFKEYEENEHILQYSKLLDFDFSENRVCLLVDINDLSHTISSKHGDTELFGDFQLQYFQREVLSFLNLIFHETQGDIVSFLNIERFIVLKTLPYQQSYSALIESLEERLEKINTFLSSKYRVSATISVGDICSSNTGVSESYKNAKKAMNVGVKTDSKKYIHVYNERDMMLRLLPKELTTDYQSKLFKVIHALIHHDNYDILAETFISYCKNNMKLSEASRNMYIHRNTIIYRLEKISEITSLNTSNFEHCMLLYTAIQCYEEYRESEKNQSSPIKKGEDILFKLYS
ncbi:sugar diacid recognition domain-containing protein [Bacillus sp. 31A1R]|uniref:Sugar diacid recognition domain-containing protein n=1 Tax=Robertmurraya mangrovi TaxID=3098077 RepID=A0ABU5J3A5_9BACI|nr:sugar diacid recognition domain-containing protein [Bacillus sp. 31A1R]MDZ5473900.1 sugar diacid recognition domain-containing protein [Bacillus sp. 31A1R]